MAKTRTADGISHVYTHRAHRVSWKPQGAKLKCRAHRSARLVDARQARVSTGLRNRSSIAIGWLFKDLTCHVAGWNNRRTEQASNQLEPNVCRQTCGRLGCLYVPYTAKFGAFEMYGLQSVNLRNQFGLNTTLGPPMIVSLPMKSKNNGNPMKLQLSLFAKANFAFSFMFSAGR